jgi:hypothetical protein
MALKSCLTEFNTILNYWPRIGFGRNAFLSRSDVEILLSYVRVCADLIFSAFTFIVQNSLVWLKSSSVVLKVTGRDSTVLTRYAELRADGLSDVLWYGFGVEIT